LVVDLMERVRNVALAATDTPAMAKAISVPVVALFASEVSPSTRVAWSGVTLQGLPGQMALRSESDELIFANRIAPTAPATTPTPPIPRPP
jgi:hypothetical protein